MDNLNKYSCKCGQKYTSNSSLYNHIRLKHENDLAWKCFKLKMGRPLGTKNEMPIKRATGKRIPYPCKCGATLASRGALSNHWKLVHKNSDEYKPQELEKGRKRIHQDQQKEKDLEIIIQTKTESTESSSGTTQHEQQVRDPIFKVLGNLDQKLQAKPTGKGDDKTIVKCNSSEEETKEVQLSQQASSSQLSLQSSSIPLNLELQQMSMHHPSPFYQYNFYNQLPPGYSHHFPPPIPTHPQYQYYPPQFQQGQQPHPPQQPAVEGRSYGGMQPHALPNLIYNHPHHHHHPHPQFNPHLHPHYQIPSHLQAQIDHQKQLPPPPAHAGYYNSYLPPNQMPPYQVHQSQAALAKQHGPYGASQAAHIQQQRPLEKQQQFFLDQLRCQVNLLNYHPQSSKPSTH